MFAEIANFANDAAAVEKSLRLFQAFVQIAAGTAATPIAAKPWAEARGHFALARRYLRLFKWIDFGQIAKRELESETDPIRRMIAVTKSSLLALYFFMEMFCITNAMNMTSSPHLDALQHHALQIWFLAICASLILSTYDLLISPSTPYPTLPTNQVYTSYLLDLCDILIPGSAVGWIPADSVTVGVTSSISSLVSGGALWSRVQREAREREVRRRVRQKVRFEGVDEKGVQGVDEKVVLDEKAALKESDKVALEKSKKDGLVVGGKEKATPNSSVKKRTRRA